MKTHKNNTLRQLLTLTALCALSLGASVMGCDDGLKETKSSSIELNPSSITFPPFSSGERSQNEIVKIIHGGERALTVSRIYLAKYAFGELTEIQGCDRVSEGIPPSQVLTPEVLPLCSVLISERPELPFTLNNNSLRQVTVTYRPLPGEVGLRDVSLIVESDANGMYVEEVPLSASGSSPELRGESFLSFSANGENTQSYYVRNIGGASLNITNVYIQRRADSPVATDSTGAEVPEFSYQSTCVPCTLNPDQEATMQVTYTPVDDQGPDTATMFVEATNGAGDPIGTLEVLLTTEETNSTLTVNPNPVVFTPTPGEPTPVVVSFVNSGLPNINVPTVTFEPAEMFSTPDVPSFVIGGGRAHELTVVAAINATGTGTMVLTTDADNVEGGRLRVPLIIGGGEALPLLDASTSTLSFDGVAPDMSAEQVVTLSSSGTNPVNISAVRLEGDETFEVVSGGEAGELAVGSTREVTVRFNRPAVAPGAPVNTYAGTLVIESDNLGGDVMVNLTAAP